MTISGDSVAATALRVLCGARFADAERARFVLCLERGLDWTALLQAALAQDVAALAAHRLLTLPDDRLDDGLRQVLMHYLECERLRGRILATELAEILQRLSTQGIAAIPIKGPQLALELYSDAGLRRSSDLDILVRDADVGRTLAVLEAMGYRHDTQLNPQQIEAVRRYGGQYILFHAHRTAVEPHWLIAPSTLAFDLDYGRLWQRTRAGRFQGIPCRRLPPEEELLSLCLHGAKEQWQKLKWICDIAAFLAVHPEIEWQRLHVEAAAQGCLRMLDVGLLLAARWLDAPLPTEVWQRLRHDAQAGRLAAHVIAQQERKDRAGPNPYRLSAYYWRMRERARDRWTYAFRTVLTPRTQHYALVALPVTLRWGYYPLKLVWDYLLIPAHVLRKKLRLTTRL